MAPALDPERLGDHLDRLYRAAWALSGSREDAEDLVQETYARVLSRPRLLRNEDDLGYLLRALRNTFLNERRTRSRRLRPEPLPDQMDVVADPRAAQPHAQRVGRRSRLARRRPSYQGAEAARRRAGVARP